MTIHLEKRDKCNRDKYEYKGNMEVGKVLELISEVLLKYPKDYEENILVSTWCGQIINKIEIIQER